MKVHQPYNVICTHCTLFSPLHQPSQISNSVNIYSMSSTYFSTNIDNLTSQWAKTSTMMKINRKILDSVKITANVLSLLHYFIFITIINQYKNTQTQLWQMRILILPCMLQKTPPLPYINKKTKSKCSIFQIQVKLKVYLLFICLSLSFLFWYL